uniref:HR-like lesion-inducer n=1 Tax=Kalanchoe fedtschenkoi TaxID=63787 RepID=A0A7N0RID4_KALFE
MAFISFLGRVLFASVFILSAYQEFNEFGLDGGPAARAIEPRFKTFAGHVKTHAGLQIPDIETKILVAASVAFKGVGSVLFIFGSSIGAYLLALHQLIATPILYDFYNYDHDEKEYSQLFSKFNQHMALFGALLFFIGMKNSFPKRN